jgi:hypothetical protein
MKLIPWNDFFSNLNWHWSFFVIIIKYALLLKTTGSKRRFVKCSQATTSNSHHWTPWMETARKARCQISQTSTQKA